MRGCARSAALRRGGATVIDRDVAEGLARTLRRAGVALSDAADALEHVASLPGGSQPGNRYGVHCVDCGKPMSAHINENGRCADCY